MWVNINLKAPDDGSWVALTRVSSDGDLMPLGYVDDADFKFAIDVLSDIHRKYMDALDA